MLFRENTKQTKKVAGEGVSLSGALLLTVSSLCHLHFSLRQDALCIVIVGEHILPLFSPPQKIEDCPGRWISWRQGEDGKGEMTHLPLSLPPLLTATLPLPLPLPLSPSLPLLLLFGSPVREEPKAIVPFWLDPPCLIYLCWFSLHLSLPFSPHHLP